MNDIICFIQGEVIGFQVLLDSLIHVVQGRPGGLLQFSKESTSGKGCLHQTDGLTSCGLTIIVELAHLFSCPSVL